MRLLAIAFAAIIGGIGNPNVKSPSVNLSSNRIPSSSLDIEWDGFGRPGLYGASYNASNIDCVADASGGTFSAGSLGACPATPVGSPTTVGSPFWPSGFSGAQQMAVRLPVTDYYTLGNVAAPAGSFSGCVIYNYAATDSYQTIFSRMRVGNQWMLWHATSLDRVYVWKNNSNYSYIDLGLPVVNAWNVACWSYQYVADGTSVLRANYNGTAASPVMTAVGPVQQGVTQNLEIGGNGYVNGLNGSVVRATYMDGVAYSDAQLAAMVGDQMRLLADKPTGQAISFARNDAQLECPITSSDCYNVAAGVPVIGDTGLRVWGAAENANAFWGSDDITTGWSKDAAVTVEPASASCPMAPDQSARMTLVTTAASGEGVWQDVASTPCRGTWIALATGDSACGGVNFTSPVVSHSNSLTPTATPTRYTDYYAGEHGIYTYRVAAGSCARWCLWRAIGANTSSCSVTMPAPYTAGAAYTGPATVVSTANTLASGSTWATSGVYTSSDFVPASGIFAEASAGTLGAANTWFTRGTTAILYFATYDAAAGEKYVVSAEPSPGTRSIGIADVAGALTIAVDGTVTSGAAVGAGTGILASHPATVLIGNTTAGYQFGGGISVFKQCKRLRAGVCPQ